jgi:hypothetical protein
LILPDLIPHNHLHEEIINNNSKKYVENSSSLGCMGKHPTAPKRDITKNTKSFFYLILQLPLQVEEPSFYNVLGLKQPITKY